MGVLEVIVVLGVALGIFSGGALTGKAIAEEERLMIEMRHEQKLTREKVDRLIQERGKRPLKCKKECEVGGKVGYTCEK
nr:hypothetical protein BdHM001_36450 [Bdellovibrio sp. HM001]